MSENADYSSVWAASLVTQTENNKIKTYLTLFKAYSKEEALGKVLLSKDPDESLVEVEVIKVTSFDPDRDWY